MFSNIEKQIQNHLLSRIVKELHNQMCELVLYQCKKIEIGIAVDFSDDQEVCIK